MTATLDLTTATPVEIDTALHEIYERLAGPSAALTAAADRVWKIEQSFKSTRTFYTVESLTSAEAHLAKCQEAYQVIKAETVPFDAEFERRGGWTRAFLVLNTGGHVHKDRSCSTCYFNTRYGWLPSLSGHDEAEIIEAAGSDACTVCYPNAPVVKRERTIFHSTEQVAQQARQERQAKKDAAAAKKAEKGITSPDGSPLRIFSYTAPARVVTSRSGDKHYPARDIFDLIETAHAAKAWLTDSQEPWGRKPTPEAIQQVAEALAAKFGTTPEAEIEAAKVRAAKRK